jgi:hypothetical protein
MVRFKDVTKVVLVLALCFSFAGAGNADADTDYSCAGLTDVCIEAGAAYEASVLNEAKYAECHDNILCFYSATNRAKNLADGKLYLEKKNAVCGYADEVCGVEMRASIRKK